MVKARQDEQREQRILKAMACGTPVVGFKVGGISEMVEEGRTGLLAPGGNVTELAQAIDFLLDHEREANGNGGQGAKAGRRNVSARWAGSETTWIFISDWLRTEKRRKLSAYKLLPVFRRPVAPQSPT